MTFLGKMLGGVIVIEGNDRPAEGAAVTIETLDTGDARVGTTRVGVPTVGVPIACESSVGMSSVGASLLKVAGTLDGFPVDASTNVDHYLYGLPRK